MHYEQDKPLELIAYDEYRELCDTVNDFRKVGIQTEESFQNILNDPRTVFLNFRGKRVPLLAPIEYEIMYDQERCQEMTARQNIMLLAIPLPILGKESFQEQVGVDADTAIIIEEFRSPEETVGANEHVVPSLIGGTHVHGIDFVNPDLALFPGHDTAWMASYSFEFGPREPSTEVYDDTDFYNHVAEIWRQYCHDNDHPLLPTERKDGTYFMTAEQLALMPEVIEGMWDISSTGFGKVLGAHHPVAMEFDREFFDKQIAAKNTVTTVHFAHGIPVCFGFIGLDMSNNEWLNCDSDVLRNDIEDATNKERPYIHFHELISNGLEGMGFSKNILATFLEIASRTGYDYSVFFESTNLSSTYIPQIVEKEVSRREDLTMKQDIKILGKLTYWAIVEDA